MKSYCFALAALAAIGFSGAAYAGEVTHSDKAAGPVAMSDSELDKVTAGLDANGREALRLSLKGLRENLHLLDRCGSTDRKGIAE